MNAAELALCYGWVLWLYLPLAATYLLEVRQFFGSRLSFRRDTGQQDRSTACDVPLKLMLDPIASV